MKKKMIMTYNEKHFEKDLNQHLNNRLQSLTVWQNHTLDFLIRYLLASNEKEQLPHCNAFLHILVKIRFNLESVGFLLPLMFDDYRYKTSVNLIYRSLVDDIINSYYLFCTIVLDDPDQHALDNELSILHKEYVLSVIKGIKADFEFEKFVDELKDAPHGHEINVEEEFKQANPDLVGIDGNWKKNQEIRATTHPILSKELNQGKSNIFISESKKLEFIRKRGVQTHHNIEALFKYLSQYQHFSPKAHDLLNSHIEFDINVYQRCLGELLMLLDQLMQFLELHQKAELKEEWDALAPLVFDSFSDK